MTIGIEAQRLLRPHKHGMDIVALETIRAMAGQPQHDFVVLVKPDTDRACLPVAPNIRVVAVAGGPYPVWEQYALPNAARQHGIDLLHCTANTAPVRAPVPVVLTLHDIIFLEKAIVGGTAYQRFGNLYRRWNVPRVVKTARQIVTVSNYERQRILEHLGLEPNRVITVPNAVSQQFRLLNDPAQLAAVRERFGLPGEFIFFLGNADPKKNVPNVLRALALLKQRKELTLPLVMANVSVAYVTGVLAEIGCPALLEDMILCGYIPNPLLPAVYNAATIFLCPSLRESFGLPILEAMACGTPVLTASTTAMPEVAGNAALLANPALPEEMAAKIDNMLTSNALLANLRQKGLERAALFSWASTAAQLIRVYEQAN